MQLLHNELVVEIPFALRLKMIYQAAKGMHFLHSSGIVHRDLKSLNILLDSKWNVKVSDFGLTDLKESFKSRNQTAVGSVPWMAPELLEEQEEIDYVLCDMYHAHDLLQPPTSSYHLFLIVNQIRFWRDTMGDTYSPNTLRRAQRRPSCCRSNQGRYSASNPDRSWPRK